MIAAAMFALGLLATPALAQGALLDPADWSTTAPSRKLLDAGDTQQREIKAAKRDKVKRGSTIAATATCPEGFTVVETLECSDTSGNFDIVSDSPSDVVEDGVVVGVTCQTKNVRGPKFIGRTTTVTVRVMCEAPEQLPVRPPTNPAAGGNCGSNADCNPGAYCQLTRCYFGEEGDACGVDSDCEDGLTCRPHLLSSPQSPYAVPFPICKRLAAAGSLCAFDNDCEGYCQLLKCRDGNKGDPCGKTADCKDGRTCKNKLNKFPPDFVKRCR